MNDNTHTYTHTHTNTPMLIIILLNYIRYLVLRKNVCKYSQNNFWYHVHGTPIV